MPCTRPQLIAELSRIDGRREVTLETIGRRLCAAGLLGSNGPNGPPATMGWSDAANLLIGAGASLTAAEAPDVVARFRQFQPWIRTAPGTENNLPGEIHEAETFGQAVEALLAAAPTVEASFLDFVQQAFPTALPSFQARLAFGPLAVVAFEIDFVRGAFEAAAFRVVSNHLEKRQVLVEIMFHPADGAPSTDQGADRVVTTRVGLQTVRALYGAVAPRHPGAAAAPARHRCEGASGDVPGGNLREPSNG